MICTLWKLRLRAWLNLYIISNTHDHVWAHVQTPRRELKIRRTAEYFWRNSMCLEMRSNTVLRIQYSFPIETKTNEEIESWNSMLVKIRYLNTVTGWIIIDYFILFGPRSGISPYKTLFSTPPLHMKLCLVLGPPPVKSVSLGAVTSILTQRLYLAYRRTICLKRNEGNYFLINRRNFEWYPVLRRW